jgi:phosphoribosylaminoimidazole carboxylase PurE protein
MAEVGIIAGSDSDIKYLSDCFSTLREFNVTFEFIISSAHRTPETTIDWAKNAKDRGNKIIIAAAGGAAHLPGVVAAHTLLPVIGIPIPTQISGGLDSILSILQMPGGISVATMPVGNAGGKNAALFAVQILSLENQLYAEKLKSCRQEMARKIAEKNQSLQFDEMK